MKALPAPPTERVFDKVVASATDSASLKEVSPPSEMLMPLPLSSCSNNPAESLARTLSVNKYFPSAIPICSLKSQEAVPLLHEIFLSVAPFNVMPPPFAVSFVGEFTEPSSIFLSSTLTVVELIVETVPFTVKFPATERSSNKENL